MSEELSFDNLGIKENLLRGVYSYGFEKPSKIQFKSIPVINERKDIIAQSQSGTGKTGAFTIGSLNLVKEDLNKTQILIVNPTRELAEQTINVIHEISSYTKITKSKAVGGTNVNACSESLRREPHVVVGTPGRIMDMINKRCLITSEVTTLVIDEADEMLSFGFLPTLQEIIRCMPKDAQICLFSATMPQEMLELTDKFMNNPERILVNKEELTLEGISQYYINTKVNHWKYDVLTDIYDSIQISQCIIYINSKNKLMEIYQKLIENNFPVGMIHGSLQTNERDYTVKKFREGEIRILLSTDLLSRGIDIQQLSLVINYDLPREKETYIHRIGRSGRYGRKGVAINFITDYDLEHLQNIRDFYNTKIEEMPNDIQNVVNV
tara:strand:- start:800 stop:1942 length:1143 start_codon:yes stop_codon:yes gene_type:complete